MITPNWNILLWFLLALSFFSSMTRIYYGAVGKERDTHYDNGDIVAGVVWIIIILLMFIFGT